MPLVLGFVLLLGGVLLLSGGVTGASFADVLNGSAGEIYRQGQTSAQTSAQTAAAAAGTSTNSPTQAAKGVPAATPAPSSGYTPTSWAKGLLLAIGAPITSANVASIVAWEGAEGGNWNNLARYNPLNTTQVPSSGSYGNTGAQGDIKVYSSWEQGLSATVATLHNGDYNDIITALKTGRGLGSGTYQGLLTWSNNGYGSI